MCKARGTTWINKGGYSLTPSTYVPLKRIDMCICACVCMGFVYVCLCVCVCVCVWEREREGERERETNCFCIKCKKRQLYKTISSTLFLSLSFFYAHIETPYSSLSTSLFLFRSLSRFIANWKLNFAHFTDM
jgi:hypothetical protein